MFLSPFKPMEPKLASKPFNSAEYLFQVKWDGVRCLSYIDNSDVLLFNRRLNPRTKQYPELIDTLKKLSKQGVVLDGEIIAFNSEHKPDFRRVLKRDLAKKTDKIKGLVKAVPVFYMVFDLIYLEGQPLTETPLTKRQELLECLIPQNPIVKVVESISTEGVALYQASEAEQLEGIVAKRTDSPYLIGAKSDLWKKIKVWQDLTAVVGGYTSKQGEIRSLLLGLYHQESGNLYYIGNVSSGISHSEWTTLQRFFESNTNKQKKDCPFINPPKKARGEVINWASPDICVKVQFLEWTSDYKLRNPTLIAFVEADPKASAIFN